MGIELGLGAVNIVHPLLDNVDWPEQRTAAQNILDRLVDAAHRDEAIPVTITATDIALATIRFCRALAIGIDTAEERGTPIARQLPRRTRHHYHKQ